jgi:hypothetical protein
MRTLGTRRAILVAGAAAVAAAVLAGCSAGQVAETSMKRPSDPGVNADNSDGSVSIRNLSVVYNGPQGYPAGGSAPLELGLFNQTTQQITVNISSTPPTDGTVDKSVLTGTSVGLSGGPATPSSAAVPEPSGSRPAAQPETSQGANAGVSTPSVMPSAEPSVSTEPTEATQPARVVLGPLGYAIFLPGDKQTLQVQGLSGRLTPGRAVYITFEFSNGAQALTLPAPVSVPDSAGPRGSAVPDENVESE